ncbi:MAG TPA: MarR family transcriptional regulator [Candidatus Dormibacteraeota bacterium]|nr:MarR family transcriptional regulator [Candidatus Dormibacteraeota bacterium]
MTQAPTVPQDTGARLAELLTCAARRFHHSVGARLAPLGLTWAQSRVMRLIAEPGSSLRMADIAARLDIVPRSATSMVDALEEGGLVSRRPDPQDRRSVLVSLTDEGRQLLQGLHDARRTTAEAMLGTLGEGDRAELVRLLEAVVANSGGCDAGRARR